MQGVVQSAVAKSGKGAVQHVTPSLVVFLVLCWLLLTHVVP